MPSLVEALRPHSIDQILGQDHLLGPAGSLRRFCNSSNFSSFCLSGPSGSGKTSIARATANLMSCRFVPLSISGTNFAEVGDLLEEARKKKRYGGRTLILIKYFFRLSREEQHILLPYVESRDVVLCVTEDNIGTVMVPELLTFFTIFTTIKLEPCHLEKIIDVALGKMGEGRLSQIKVEKKGRDFLVSASNGNAKIVLNVLEVAASGAIYKHDMQAPTGKRKPGKGLMDTLRDMASGEYQRKLKSGVECCDESQPFRGKSRRELDLANRDCYLVPQAQAQIQQDITVTLASIQETLEDQNKTEDPDNKLAFTLRKSMHESDVSAAIYWLARLLEDGMHPLYLAKWLVSFATEDVGLADPQAVSQAMICYSACENLDVDCSNSLALCVAYLTSAPKSNSVHQAISNARTLVKGLP